MSRHVPEPPTRSQRVSLILLLLGTAPVAFSPQQLLLDHSLVELNTLVVTTTVEKVTH